MKAFTIACIVAIVLALGAAWILDMFQVPVSEAYNATVSTRI
ncbi:MAG TPA: hypothetical protein VNK48_08930 [Xanthobacteraceae bacterium]|nr:hypothetical protein [Xanthobacteraceae bacterium]